MNFTIDRETLLQPLIISSGVVEAKSAQPILMTLLIEWQGNRVVVTGTDNEMTMVSSATVVGDASGSTDGRAAVNAKKMVDIVKSFEPGTLIDIALTNNQRLCLTSGQGRFELGTLPAEDYPQIPSSLVDASWIEVRSASFKERIRLTSFAMALQDVRPFLKGLFLHATPEGVNVVATDGHRLALSELVLESGQLEADVIIPRKAVSEIVRLLSEAPEMIKIGVNKTHVQLELDTYCFTSRLIEGQYPDYSRVIPQNFLDQVVMDREDLKNSLQRVAILSNDALRCVRFSFSQGVLRISATNQDAEQGAEELPCDYSGDDISIGLNANYVLDVLEALKSPIVHFNMVDAASSVMLQSESDISSKFVIMPMRI